MKPGQRLLMICTGAKGGMRSVVDGYRESGIFDRWEVERIEPHAEGSLSQRLRMALTAYRRCVQLVARRQVGLMHVHAAMRGSFWRKSVFVWIARLAAIPVILHLHGSETVKFMDGQRRPVRRLIRANLEAASRVVVLSPRWRSYIATVAPRARIEVLANYVRVPPYRAPRAPDGTFRLLFLGAVGTRKGIYPLIEAVAEAARITGLKFELVVGGDGEIEQAREHARRFGAEALVRFEGWVGGETKLRLLREADAYVLPSFNEGLPMSLLEAMAESLPVVSTTVGGIPDLIDSGVDGWLVEPGDAAALARVLATLASDAALRAEVAARGWQRVSSEFSEVAVVPRLEAMYQELTEGRG